VERAAVTVYFKYAAETARSAVRVCPDPPFTLLRMNIKDLQKGMTDVTLQGWVFDLRDFGSVKFIQLRDATGIIQVTINMDEDAKEITDTVKELTKETALIITGDCKENEKARTGIEVIPKKITIISKADSDLPIPVFEKKSHTQLPKRLDYRSLDLRKPKMQAIFKVQSTILQGFQEYLNKNDFTQVFTPCILGVASESGSEVFPLIYFNTEAFMRQDPQLHRQLTIAGGFPRIYDIGPAWRAELSHTQRHLCEHRVCAVELAFIKDEYDVMKVEQELVISALKKVKEQCANELKRLNIELTIPTEDFPVLEFPEVYTILESKGKFIAPGDDLDREAEGMIWEYVQEKYNCEFYFVNRFPFAEKPFYVMRDDNDKDYARSTDMYFKGVELSSGGQREHRYEKIMENLKEKNANESEVEWFTKFFKYGVPPHGGFAIGIERITQTLLNIENIRDCVLFPRDPERLVP
jgi:nondiscriminating aspartyl-tRNA synthetase